MCFSWNLGWIWFEVSSLLDLEDADLASAGKLDLIDSYDYLHV